MSLVDFSQRIWWAGVNSVEARHCTENFFSVDQEGLHFGDFTLRHDQYRNILVVGGGKGIGEMGTGLEAVLLDRLPADKKLSGRLNVPDDKVVALKAIKVVGCRPPGQNLPTDRVVASTQQIIRMIQESDRADLVIFLIAGGGSALLELPIPPLTLDELQALTRMLSQRGASINQLNAVRKQLSQIKGGGMARIANGRTMVTLAISDVLGDPLDIIASGPTVPEGNRCLASANQDAIRILNQFALAREEVPATIWSILEQTPSGTKDARCRDQREHQTNLHFVIANNQSAVASAQKEALALGFESDSETDFEPSRVEEVAAKFVARLELAASGALGPRGGFISGGEPIVLLGPNPGQGGRNQHLALTVLEILVSRQFHSENFQFTFLSGGTDGEDGTTTVAGGVISNLMAEKVVEQNQLSQIRKALQTGDSHEWFKRWNGLFETGRTGTNVCDLRILLWECGMKQGLPFTG